VQGDAGDNGSWITQVNPHKTIGATEGAAAERLSVMQILLSILFFFVGAPEYNADVSAMAIVSKDSLSFRIPARDINDVWKWNALPNGTFEHQWVIDIPVGEWGHEQKKMVAHFAVIQESQGPPIIHGDLSDLLADSKVYFWATEKETGAMYHVRKIDTFVKPTYKNGTIGFTLHRLGWVEPITRFRPETMTVRGYYANGTTYEDPVAVINVKDPREREARSISGPFSPEEYAIYQTVVDRTLHDARRHQPNLKIVILNSAFCQEPYSNERQNLKVLNADDDSVADYLEKRTMEADLTSLKALGYHVWSAESYNFEKRAEGPKTTMCSVRLSRIGFNSTVTQAIVYCGHSCGALAGKGEAILLEKMNDEWLVSGRVMLWIS
jgi:hypothetical protein